MNFKHAALIVFNASFQITCFTVAGFFIVQQFQVYYSNQDLSYVSYQKFNAMPKDLYPLISFCVYSRSTGEMLMEEKLLKVNSTLTPFLYSDMLLGYANISDEFVQTPFDNVTIDFFEDMILWFHTSLKSNGLKNLWNAWWNDTNEAPFYVSYQDPYYRCFTRKWAYVKDEIIKEEVLEINATKLYEKPRRKIKVYFHYAGQLLRQLEKYAMEFRKQDFRQDDNILGSDKVLLDLNVVDVLRKRSDSLHPCNQSLLNDDMQYIKTAVQQIGCIPTYWERFAKNVSNDHLKFPRCSKKEQYSSLFNYFLPEEDISNVTSRYTQPCDYLTTEVLFRTEVRDKTYQYTDKLRFEVKYHTEIYKEAINKQACTLGNLWSSIGGFIGIFLGFSLLQVYFI